MELQGNNSGNLGIFGKIKRQHRSISNKSLIDSSDFIIDSRGNLDRKPKSLFLSRNPRKVSSAEKIDGAITVPISVSYDRSIRLPVTAGLGRDNLFACSLLQSFRIRAARVAPSAIASNFCGNPDFSEGIPEVCRPRGNLARI